MIKWQVYRVALCVVLCSELAWSFSSILITCMSSLLSVTTCHAQTCLFDLFLHGCLYCLYKVFTSIYFLITYYFSYLLFPHSLPCLFLIPFSLAFILYPSIRILKAYWIRPLALLIIPAPVLKTSPKPWPLCPPSLLHLLLCSPRSQKPERRHLTDIIAEESRPLHNLLTKSTLPTPGPKQFRSFLKKC